MVNPILVGALRSSAAVNQDFTDMGDEITNTLPIDGQAAMTGQFKAADGTALRPGISFSADQNLGFRRRATDEMAWVAGGQDRAIMDADGRLTLSNGIQVTGSVNISSNLAPQSLTGTGQTPLTMRRNENTTDEVTIATFESGDGSGTKASLRMVGGAANDVATMRFYIGTTLVFSWTASLFTKHVDVAFGTNLRADTDGYVDLTEVTAPSSPAANVGRMYCRDASGTTMLFYKDSGGAERPIGPTMDRQVFTASGTWTKPAGGTQALIECWGGGASGGKATTNTAGGGGGGGAYASKMIALASLSASVSVTVGAGGTAQTTALTAGNPGGDTSFGSVLSAFGGGAGAGSGTATNGGGGGGGSQAAGAAGSGSAGDSTGGAGGTPRGSLGAATWGAGNTAGDANCNSFGGGGGGGGDSVIGTDVGGAGGAALLGGGGGGSGQQDGAVAAGAGSVFGGGGGGGGNSVTPGGTGGTSIFGGNGGAGNFDANAGVAGTTPGGGGGGTETGTSGAGARGEVRITVW